MRRHLAPVARVGLEDPTFEFPAPAKRPREFTHLVREVARLAPQSPKHAAVSPPAHPEAFCRKEVHPCQNEIRHQFGGRARENGSRVLHRQTA